MGVTSNAINAERDRHLHALDACHVFEINVTRLTRQVVEEALNDEIVTV